jgi:hypothetical protein
VPFCLRIRRLQVQVLPDAPFSIKDFRSTKTPQRRLSPDKFLANEVGLSCPTGEFDPRSNLPDHYQKEGVRRRFLALTPART